MSLLEEELEEPEEPDDPAEPVEPLELDELDESADELFDDESVEGELDVSDFAPAAGAAGLVAVDPLRLSVR
ncbi:hypothetical protein GCM10027579_27870 [Calidifontibacter terrae]